MHAGVSFFDMDRSELVPRYAPAAPDDAKRLWDELYEGCLDGCVHGKTCPSVGVCTQGRRITTVRPPLRRTLRPYAAYRSHARRHVALTQQPR